MTRKNEDTKSLLSDFASEEYCYLTTKGRVSGRPHEIEIWFGVDGYSVYFLSGGGSQSDWVKNLLADPHVSVRITDHIFDGTARVVIDATEELMARHMLAGKYQGWKKGRRLSDWAGQALPVAVDLKFPDMSQ